MSTRTVVLVGPMGSGKSTVGRALARRLGVGHVDTDDLVVEAAGASIPEIFADEGEAEFREHEYQALHLAVAGSPKVISTGGGIVTTKSSRELLAGGDALVVWLDASIDTLVRRVGDGRRRPLLADGDVRATLVAKVAERAESYREVADVRVDTSGRSRADCVDAIVVALDDEVQP